RARLRVTFGENGAAGSAPGRMMDAVTGEMASPPPDSSPTVTVSCSATALVRAAASSGLPASDEISRMTVSLGTVADTWFASSETELSSCSRSITGPRTRGDVATSEYDAIWRWAKVEPWERSAMESEPSTEKNTLAVEE